MRNTRTFPNSFPNPTPFLRNRCRLLSSPTNTMLTSRGITRLSRRAVNGAKRTNGLFSTSASVLTRAGLSVSAGTQSGLRPTRFAASTSGMHPSTC